VRRPMQAGRAKSRPIEAVPVATEWCSELQYWSAIAPTKISLVTGSYQSDGACFFDTTSGPQHKYGVKVLLRES
jgi:hypothetical protein